MLPKLSPDGSKLCALTRFDDRHYALTLINLVTKQVQPVIKADALTTLNYWWKSDWLLVAVLEGDGGRRIYQTVDLKNGKVFGLEDLETYARFQFVSDLPDDPEQMLFRATNVGGPEILKVNLRTGHATNVEAVPAYVENWCINRSGEALGGYGYDPMKERWFIIWRPAMGAKWQHLDAPPKKVPDVLPFTVGPDQHKLIALDFSHNPTGSISYFDPTSGKTEQMFAPAEMEPTRFLTRGDAPQIVAAEFESDRSTLRFFDPELEKIDQWIEAAMPGTLRAFQSFSHDQSKALIYAETDRNAGVYCLADLATKKVAVLRSSMSGLNPSAMANSRHFNFSTSDHLKISGRITLPPGVERPPLVLLTGSTLTGPRSSLGFDCEAQFFAGRGYACARIDHRGTAGFGRSFAEAGDFQVTTGIVRDLSEGTEWLARQGWIDGKRVAVLGEHWGGLIAFQLAAKPGFARALVNIETPMNTENWYVNTFMTSLLDPEQFIESKGGIKVLYDYKKAVDPIAVVEKLQAPSFHYYSKFENGENVEIRAAEAHKLEAALKKHGTPFEISYADPVSRKTSVQTTDWRQTASCYEAIATFLAKNL